MNSLGALNKSTILQLLRDFFNLHKQQYMKSFKQLDGGYTAATSTIGSHHQRSQTLSVLLCSSKVRIIIPLILQSLFLTHVFPLIMI